MSDFESLSEAQSEMKERCVNCDCPKPICRCLCEVWSELRKQTKEARLKISQLGERRNLSHNRAANAMNRCFSNWRARRLL